jgi:hypothetical protein
MKKASPYFASLLFYFCLLTQNCVYADTKAYNKCEDFYPKGEVSDCSDIKWETPNHINLCNWSYQPYNYKPGMGMGCEWKSAIDQCAINGKLCELPK